jgi:hypothetical protein
MWDIIFLSFWANDPLQINDLALTAASGRLFFHRLIPKRFWRF